MDKTQFDVFLWANEIDEVKNNVSAELFLFNKNYTPYKIKYSDKSLNEIMLSDLYDQVGVVMQDPFYFNLTILENLRLAMPDASEERIKKACCCARIYDFIESLEWFISHPQDGYDCRYRPRLS